MCEINPKRKEIFTIEFFTAHEMTLERWRELVHQRLVVLEEAFNYSGEIRVHIHEEEKDATEGKQEG